MDLLISYFKSLLVSTLVFLWSHLKNIHPECIFVVNLWSPLSFFHHTIPLSHIQFPLSNWKDLLVIAAPGQRLTTWKNGGKFNEIPVLYSPFTIHRLWQHLLKWCMWDVPCWLITGSGLPGPLVEAQYFVWPLFLFFIGPRTWVGCVRMCEYL